MGIFSNSIIINGLIQQRQKLNDSFIWLTIVDTEEVKEFIINLNTEEQLYLKGINSLGEPLQNSKGNTTYTPLTIKLKRAKGGKAGRVENITLFDKGDYYESHDVKVDITGFIIDADPIKDDGTNLFDEWGDDILGLTEESLQILVSFLVEKYVNYTRETIFKA